MASVLEYKRFENSVIHTVKKAAAFVGRGVAGVFRGAGGFLTRRYTVVFVPHSEKKVYNFHITVLSMLCFLLVAAGVFAVVFRTGASSGSGHILLAGNDSQAQELQGSLDRMRDEVAVLRKEAEAFKNALTSAFSALGSDADTRENPSPDGDLSSFFDIRETPEGTVREIDDMRQISALFTSAMHPLRQIGEILDSQSALLTEIPSIWPIKNGLGQITMFFGHNINPFHGGYYLHLGIDISTFRRGDPIVATADGQVVTLEYAHDYGNYVIIRHKHGYYTRYAHMLSANVRLGQNVQQGDVIGYIGNTGLSTGPHLHYEVHVGSDVVDPYKYIKIRSTIAKQGR